MNYEHNRAMRKNGSRRNDRIYYDDCNVLYKICGVVTFVWGIMVIFGVAATIIGAGGPEAVANLMGAYVYMIFAGAVMFIDGIYTYLTRYMDVSIAGFLLSVLSAALSCIMIGILARYIPAFVSIAIVPAVSAVLIALEHVRHAN